MTLTGRTSWCVAALITLGACKSDDQPAKFGDWCGFDDDCETRLVCASAVCTVACEQRVHCSGRWGPSTDCLGGYCRDTCKTDEDCKKGFACTSSGFCDHDYLPTTR